MIRVELCSAAATLAVIGFRQVRKLEIDGERLGELVGIFDSEIGNDGAGLRHQIITSPLRFRVGGFPMLDQEPPETLDDVEQCLAGLLNQNTAEQNSSERTSRRSGSSLAESERSQLSRETGPLVGRGP